MIARSLRRLARDRRGVTVIEFAFVFPVFLIMLMGGSEVVYQVYVQSILDGAIQKAGRDSAIQGGGQRGDELDDKVLSMVRTVAAAAKVDSSSRLNYANFALVRGEKFTDGNGNGRRDAGECFEDVNGNKQWDVNPGIAGQGGANDVTLYTLSIRYPRLFPVTGVLGWSADAVLTARTLLKNQPYASQTKLVVTTICT